MTWKLFTISQWVDGWLFRDQCDFLENHICNCVIRCIEARSTSKCDMQQESLAVGHCLNNIPHSSQKRKKKSMFSSINYLQKNDLIFFEMSYLSYSIN